MIQTFYQRIRSSTFIWLINRHTRLFYDWIDRISCTAIDSSGFTSSSANHYYSWSTGNTRKGFPKTSMSVDTDRQIMTGLKISQHLVYEILTLKNFSNNATNLDTSTLFHGQKIRLGGIHQLIHGALN
jgi:hypothetical protein